MIEWRGGWWCGVVLNDYRDGDFFWGGWYFLGSKLKIGVICERGCVLIFY